MNVSCATLELIVQEHLHRPVTGDILLVGRASTDITPRTLANLLALYNLTPRQPQEGSPGPLGPDAAMTLADLLHALADTRVSALGDPDFAGPGIDRDLNLALPGDAKEKFDFIFDTGEISNAFNGPQWLMNLSALLRPGGRMLIVGAANSEPDAYLQLSPDWFYDFFAVNTYADCKVYVLELPEDAEPVQSSQAGQADLPPQEGCLWHFDPAVVYTEHQGFQNSEIVDFVRRYSLIIAEKGPTSTSNLAPCQMHYRGSDTAPYVEGSLRFRASARPLFVPRTGEAFARPSIGAWETVYPIRRFSRRLYPELAPSPNKNMSPVRVPGVAGEMYAEILASQDSRRPKMRYWADRLAAHAHVVTIKAKLPGPLLSALKIVWRCCFRGIRLAILLKNKTLDVTTPLVRLAKSRLAKS